MEAGPFEVEDEDETLRIKVDASESVEPDDRTGTVDIGVALIKMDFGMAARCRGETGGGR